MKQSGLLILGIGIIVGTAAGILYSRKNPKHGVLIGAAAGILAGSVALRLCKCVTEGDDGIGYYTKSSPLYKDVSDMEYL